MTQPIGGYRTLEDLLAGLERGEPELTITSAMFRQLIERFLWTEHAIERLAELASPKRPTYEGDRS